MHGHDVDPRRAETNEVRRISVNVGLPRVIGATRATVPVSGPIQVIERHPAGISVLLAHRATLPGALDQADVEAVTRVDALAADWRHWVLQQLDRA